MSYLIIGENRVDLPKIDDNEISLSIDAVKTFGKISSEPLSKALKYISQFYMNKINAIITEMDTDFLFDEMIIFSLDTDNIESISQPTFMSNGRTEQEGFAYKEEASRLINLFKDEYLRLKKEGLDRKILFNEPILIEDAYGTQFDIMIIIDTGYIMFLNKKDGTVPVEELKAIKKEVYDMTYVVRLKIQSAIG